MPEYLAVPGRRLGRLAPSHAPALHLRAVLTGTVPAHPAAADHLSRVPAWMLGGNDRFGTCGPTYVANLVVLTWKYLLGLDVTVSDEAVFDLYRRSGNPNFDPQTDADDNGVVMQDMLDALLKGGIEITHADGSTEVVKPLAFAAVDHTSLDEIRAATSIIGAVGFGVDLETAQQAQTDAGLWDYRRSSEWGGHAVMGGAYTSSAVLHTPDETVITWQEPVGTTDAFLEHQLEECWVVIWPAHLQHPDFQAGVDLAALAADYRALTGRDFPAAPPPGPGPAPVPPQPPSVTWAWLEQEAEQLPEPVREWVEGTLKWFEQLQAHPHSASTSVGASTAVNFGTSETTTS